VFPVDKNYLNYESCLGSTGYVNCNYDFVGTMFSKFANDLPLMNIDELQPVDHEYFVKGVIKNIG
jgi:hypothetical protein